MISRGKQFEKEIQKQFEKITGVAVTRLYDVTMGYKNQNNPCDYIIYKRPYCYYFECKAIHDTTLNFKSHIRQNQWEKLLEKSKTSGVKAGIICWFIKHDKTYFIDIRYLEALRKEGKKSFHILKDYDSIFVTELKGKKRRLFFDYDLELFFKEVIDE